MSTLAIKSQLKSTTCGFIAHWQIGVFAGVTFTSYQRCSIILKQWPDLVFTIWLQYLEAILKKRFKLFFTITLTGHLMQNTIYIRTFFSLHQNPFNFKTTLFIGTE